MRPQTRYATNAGVSIAYQVVGEGPVDLLWVPGWLSHMDVLWLDPSYARFVERLARFARVILLDKRGTGLSDPVALWRVRSDPGRRPVEPAAPEPKAMDRALTASRRSPRLTRTMMRVVTGRR